MSSNATHGAPLSSTELEVLQLIADGLTSVEIAQSRYRGLSTIKTQTQGILTKLGASNRPHAVAIAIRNGHIV